MSFPASLRTLYSRSKHNRSDETGHNKVENFAVSCIAYCLKFDSEFRGHFLKLCGLIEDAKENLEIYVQDGHCADLALVYKECLIVIEAKVFDDLKNLQNPDTDAFWKDKGYKAQIIELMKLRKCHTATYITLTRPQH